MENTNSGEIRHPETPPPSLAPGLYIVGTPIGNLGDLTLRAIDTLRGVDAILAEDTRHTLKLLNHFHIQAPLISCHKFNEASRTEPVLRRIAEGAALALVSDSGMPGVSDPGSRVVAACHAAGHPVFVVPGPSAVTAAVAASGFGGSGFLFEGFLPPKSAGRRRRLAELLLAPVPVVLYESTHRALKLLNDLAELAPDRRCYVGRELTKRHEESLAGTPIELLAHFEQRSIKGEWVLIIQSRRS